MTRHKIKCPPMITVKREWDGFFGRIPNAGDLGRVQVDEMRKAFYGGFGQCLMLLRDEIAMHDEKIAADIMQALVVEVVRFWAEAVAAYKAAKGHEPEGG